LFFVHLWLQYSKNALNYKEKCRNTSNVFCDVSKIVVNSKILIVSGTPIRVIFSHTQHTHTESVHADPVKAACTLYYEPLAIPDIVNCTPMVLKVYSATWKRANENKWNSSHLIGCFGPISKTIMHNSQYLSPGWMTPGH